MTYMPSAMTETRGGVAYRALLDGETGEVVAWVRDDRVAEMTGPTAVHGLPNPPEGSVRFGCATCGNVVAVPSEGADDAPWCTHGVNGDYSWAPAPPPVSGWTLMVPVTVTLDDPGRRVAVDDWVSNVRDRLVDDDDSVADVDLLYGLYVAMTGEDIPHPYEREGES